MNDDAISKSEINDFTEAWDTADLGKANLAVLGAAGVGKSTLVNTIFGAEVAPTGIGRPVTKGVNYYPHEVFGLYDFQGVESFDVMEKFVENFKKIYHERISDDPDTAIHAVWYCVKAGDLRFDEQQERVLHLLAQMGIPVVLVLTRTPYRATLGIEPDSQEFIEHLRSRNLPIVTGAPVPVAARGDEWAGTEAFGLANLIAETIRVLPEGQKAAFSAAQRIDEDSKSIQAHRVAKLASSSAAGIAATPLPLADAPLLVGVQARMMSKIAKIYQVKLSTASVAKGLAGIAAVQAGRTLSASLLRLFPGVGNAINAGVAGAITFALGKAWIELCRRDWKGDLSLDSLAQHGDLGDVLLKQYKVHAKKSRSS